MKEVDFAKLSEQYASFLVAVGGVSITVLTLALGISQKPTTAIETDARLFLVAALIVATVCCFIGAHMMAETAAFFSHLKEKLPRRWRRRDKGSFGQRLFVLASANIFIAITLVLFAMVLLPTATGMSQLAASINLISGMVFLSVAVGALVWMVLAASERVAMDRNGCYAMGVAMFLGCLFGVGCYCLSMYRLPQVIFMAIVVLPPYPFFGLQSFLSAEDPAIQELPHRDCGIQSIYYLFQCISCSCLFPHNVKVKINVPYTGTNHEASSALR